jgi:23S rRNA (pseudouridine1915-N3)-methyltransferase
VKIAVLSVGRPERTHLGALCDDYAERIRRFGIELDVRWIKGVREGGRFTDAHVMEREARSLQEALPERSRLIALAPEGLSLTTEEFARRMEGWSAPRAVFVVGGPLGLAPSILHVAHATVSLSAMTLPHELARVVLFEQIYRAVTILRGVPYHK